MTETQAGSVGRWPRHLATRAQVVAFGLVVGSVLATAGVVNGLGLYSPEGSVKAYFAALERGDSARAWSLVLISEPRAKADASLLSEAAFRAAVQAEKQRFPGLRVGAASLDAGQASVPVTYSPNQQLSVKLQRQPGWYLTAYSAPWRLLVDAGTVTVAAPTGASSLTVDGQQVSVSLSKPVGLALVPMAHLIAFGGSAMLEPQTQTVDVISGAPTSIPAVNPKLTAAATQKTTAAVAAAFARCAGATSRAPDGCPQTGNPSFESYAIAWQLVGDPTAGLTISTDSQQQTVATGHYQMIMTAGSDPSTASHQTVGGAYSAVLEISATDVQVKSIAPSSGIKPLDRPAAATDEAAKQLVSAALTKCAAATVISPPDCPQQDLYQSVGGQLQNIHWQLSGDPLANAQVSFDGATSVISVSGSFSMRVDYDFVDIGRIHHSERSTSSHYIAELFWDGSALQLITIDGS